MQNASAHLTFYLILLNQQTNEPNSLLKRSILISMFNAFNYQLIIYSFQPDIFIFHWIMLKEIIHMVASEEI